MEQVLVDLAKLDIIKKQKEDAAKKKEVLRKGEDFISTMKLVLIGKTLLLKFAILLALWYACSFIKHLSFCTAHILSYAETLGNK